MFSNYNDSYISSRNSYLFSTYNMILLHPEEQSSGTTIGTAVTSSHELQATLLNSGTTQALVFGRTRGGCAVSGSADSGKNKLEAGETAAIKIVAKRSLAIFCIQCSTYTLIFTTSKWIYEWVKVSSFMIFIPSIAYKNLKYTITKERELSDGVFLNLNYNRRCNKKNCFNLLYNLILIYP